MNIVFFSNHNVHLCLLIAVAVCLLPNTLRPQGP